MNIKPIATIHTPFPEKFGVPRQSGLVTTEAKIIFEPEFRSIDAVRGLDEYSHIWLIWGFSQNTKDLWSPTVRPPRLGGNKRMGVFATRSPFRPNKLGLSSVELIHIDRTAHDAPVLHVKGADLVNRTPIYDIKPYLGFTDCHSNAVCGFADEKREYELQVEISDKKADKIPQEKLKSLCEVLRNDPRPAYQSDPERIYNMSCLDLETQFTVKNGILTVININTTEE